MAGGNIFGIGTSGLLTAQRQLATASHNISNVNTEGYSRQRAEQEARPPQFSGNGYIGTGVEVQTTVRLANEFLEEQLRNATSQLGQNGIFLDLSSQIDNLLANPESGLTPTLEGFFNALQEANDNPSSTPARQVLLTEAETMVSRFQLLDDRFLQLNQQANQELVDLTQEVSDAARSVAKLNVEIVQKTGAGQGDLPNDLIDQREVLIKEIAKNIDVHVVYQDDGAANLFIGSGQSLVIGGIASTLATQQNRFDAEDLDIILSQGNGIANITNAVTGGELEGVLNFKNDVLEPSRRGLGRVAVALTEEVNAQHKLGMTLQGSGPLFPLGGNFFSDLSGDQTRTPTPVPITGLPGQVSTNTATLTITDSRYVTTSDYQLDYDGANYSLTRLDDNTVFTAVDIPSLNAIINPPQPYGPTDTPQGFEVAISNLVTPPNLDVGDSFLMRPTYNAAASINVSVNNVLDIALAGPVVSGEVTNADGSAINSGTGSISLPVVDSTQNTLTSLPPAAAINLQFNSGTNQFDLTNMPATNTVSFVDSTGTTINLPAPVAALPYNPATDFGGITYTVNYASGDSFTFTMEGVPNDADQFEIKRNTAPYDDNRNGLLMAQLQTTKTMENGSSDFQAGYGIIVSDVGTKTHSAQVDFLAQQTVAEQARADRESYSGVNLDEEAADLLKYQQAYQASARVITVADQMFQTLIGAV